MKDKNIFKSKFFLNLFCIPSITWCVISLIAMIPDEQESDPLTWTDLIVANIVIILIWFIISYIISLIVSIIKNKKQTPKEQTKENIKDKITIKNNSSQKEKGILIDFVIEFFAMLILICILYFGYNVIYHSRFTATIIIIISAPFFLGNLLLSCLGKNSLGQMILKYKNPNYKKQQISKEKSKERNPILMENKKDKIVVKQEKYSNKTRKTKSKKSLYKCESILDAYESKLASRYFPQTYWRYVKSGTILNLIFLPLVILLLNNVFIGIIYFCLLEIIIIIIFKLCLEYFVEKTYNIRKQRNQVEEKHTNEFYEDYFIRKTESVSVKINYSDIDKCIETDSNFYLRDKNNKLIYAFQKNRCSLELINFIREKFDNLENRLKDNSNFKGVKAYHNPIFIKRFMLILFIITIISIWLSLYTFNFVNEITNYHGLNISKNTWVFWLWLPIPIASIYLGIKYKNAGFKCTKNVVAGIIVGIILFINGMFWLIPIPTSDYSEINKYKDIISLKALPKTGELEIINWNEYFDDDKKDYVAINVYYDKENTKSLEKEIKSSDKWILSKNIKSELKIFIPSRFNSDKDSYFSIYNKTTKEYNTIPKENGIYEIYAMKYDISEKKLEIHRFNFLYQ